jgi:redox-sensing transcriptional repressor
MHNLSKINPNIPEPALRRLPWYLAYVKMLKKQGESHVSSTGIANKINVSSSQIAKDLSYVDITGKTRVGYDIDQLIDVLELFLVGSLGAALLADSGLEQYGLKIIAGFDINQQIIGKRINDIPVYDSDTFKSMNAGLNSEIGILTVPAEVAQDTADYLIESGVHAIWNFTPYRVSVPDDIVLQNTSIYAHLAVMFNRLKEKEDQLTGK